MERKHRKQTIPSDYTDKFDYATFSQRLDSLLEKNRMTQTKLAEVLDVDAQTVYRWKKGNRKTPIDHKTIGKMARIFHVDEEYLYNPQYSSPQFSDERLNQHMDSFNEKYKPFFDFLVDIGIDCAVVPPGHLLIIPDDPQPEPFEMDESQIAALRKKVSLFIQMQLLRG